MTPETRQEKYLAKASGDYSGELPEPVTREEKYLFKIAESGGGGGGDSSEYAHSLELTINSQTYVLTATLKNTSGETLGTPQTVDLPLETMVVGGSYDDTTKKVILTLKNGNTVDFSVADLVSGLQTEITSTNKLNSDLINDTNQNNKFVTSAEKTKIANALTEEVYNAGKQVNTGNNIGEIFNDYSNNKATGNFSHAEGCGTNAIGLCSHTEGNETTASSAYAHAEGGYTSAMGFSSHTEGLSAVARGTCSHAEGMWTKAGSDYQHVQGKCNIEDSNSKYAFIIGNGTDNDNRSNALAVDWEGKIYVNNSATGVDVSQLLTEEVYNAGKTTPYGTQYVIAGETYTVGRNAEIFNDYNNNKAIGEYSHAEGNRTTATGSAAHAEGGALLASGTSSHAEGGGTTASGNYSHAEGSNTTASGLIAHAEGEFTNASGRNAHTEGTNTNANGECSHAEGTYTIASSNNQHVQGKYNVEDSSSKYAFIIGNGTANNNRSNAFAVDWNGKIYVNNSETGVNVSEINNKLNNHDSALVKLVDGGTKNFLKNEGTTTSTATVNSDGTIIINGTNTSAVNIALSSTTKLPAGDYVLSTENIASNVYLTVRVANDIQYTCTGSTNSISFTLNEETTLERIYLFINANTSIDNLKLTPMICSKAAWDISQNYVPYRPSYDELVARITALENA